MAENETYEVVVNDEEQYSIWRTELDVPAGWHPVGVRGAKDECLRFIDDTWTDMRPLSVRQAMARA